MAIWKDNVQVSELVWKAKVNILNIRECWVWCYLHLPNTSFVWRVDRTIKLDAKLIETAENRDLKDINIDTRFAFTLNNRYFTSCFDSISLITSVSIRLFPCTGLLIFASDLFYVCVKGLTEGGEKEMNQLSLIDIPKYSKQSSSK